jgi:hypothetical protein
MAVLGKLLKNREPGRHSAKPRDVLAAGDVLARSRLDGFYERE